MTDMEHASFPSIEIILSLAKKGQQSFKTIPAAGINNIRLCFLMFCKIEQGLAHGIIIGMT